MPNLRKIVSREDYAVFAGADWPSYEDFLANKPITNQEIKQEINDLITKCHDRRHYKTFKTFFNSMLGKFIVRHLAPAVISLLLFFIFDGSIYKLLVSLVIFYIMNFMYNLTIHRWLSHKQFQPRGWARVVLLWNLVSIGLFRPSDWVRSHISHHQYPDSEYDPYTPKLGIKKLLISDHNDSHPSVTNINIFKDSDIKFIDNNYYVLYTLNLLLFSLIDFGVVLLSFTFLRLYTFLNSGLCNYLVHSGKKCVPVNLAWYYDLVFSGEGMHKAHHDSPKTFNLTEPGRFDLGYAVLKYLAK